MVSADARSALRNVFEERFASLISGVESQLERAVAEGQSSARSQVAEELNQAVRRLRQCRHLDEASSVLADATLPFCEIAAVFSVTGNVVRGARIRGLDLEDVLVQFRSLEIPVDRAAAFAGVIHTEDPVVAMSTAGELSQPVMELFGLTPNDRVCLFPISIIQKTVAILFAAGAVQMAALELLAQVAGLCLETRSASEHAPPEDLVNISGSKIEPANVPERTDAWSALSADEQKLHLRAQRFARVRVAEIRLYKGDTLKSERPGGDLYSALQGTIDSVRETFRNTFVSQSPSMVDYFHIELVRSLANGNAALLGQNYPGPLV